MTTAMKMRERTMEHQIKKLAVMGQMTLSTTKAYTLTMIRAKSTRIRRLERTLSSETCVAE